MTLHTYITLHYITLRYVTLHYVTLHYIHTYMPIPTNLRRYIHTTPNPPHGGGGEAEVPCMIVGFQGGSTPNPRNHPHRGGGCRPVPYIYIYMCNYIYIYPYIIYICCCHSIFNPCQVTPYRGHGSMPQGTFQFTAVAMRGEKSPFD